ncbi:MAG TPA: hybrid sensor histidine kinase/response regulator, partial [Usitatibacter sp.]|nr:hybrid sensor histidine kinase/response regulator [Usitatibacter sp.]
MPGDVEVTANLLRDSDAICVRCIDEEDLIGRLDEHVGAVLVAQEMLTGTLLHRLAGVLAQQPPWSDVPMLVVAHGEQQAGLMAALDALGNVSLLRRPMSPDAFVSSIAAAFRARRRQFQVRDLLHQQEEQSRRKDDYLAMLAHELRNPLAPIRNAAHILKSGAANPEQLARIAELVERQVGHMGRIINDLLETTRVLRGIIEIKPQQVDLAAIARNALESAQSTAQARGIALRHELEKGVEVTADPTRMRQVVDNLLDNAIKFSPKGAAVTVSVTRSGHHAVLEVADDGDGIAPALLAHIFEPFVQGHQSIDRQRGGLGLGLALVRRLVRLQQGEVTAHSEGPGLGSRFIVHMPLAVAQAREPTAAPRPEVAEQKSLRIVVAEDNTDSAETLRLLLEIDGHEVHVVHTGLAAVDEVRRQQPDALVCDIGLPGLSGYGVART